MNTINKKNHISHADYHFSFVMVIFFVWLNSNILFPGQFSEFKTGISFILVLTGTWKIIRTGIIPNFKIIGFLIIFEILASLSIWYGELNGFILSDIKSVFLIRPIIILLIISNFDIRSDKKIFFRIIDLTAIVLVLYNFVYVMGALGVFPQLLFWELDNGNVTNTSTTFIAARLTNQSALTFFLPYLAVRLEGHHQKFDFFWIVFVLGTIASLLSGRRIVQIVAIAVVVYVVGRVNSFSIDSFVKVILRVIALSTLILILGSFLSSLIGIQNIFVTIYKTIADAFSSDAASSIIRSTQSRYLLNGWSEHPFFGQGLNSYTEEYIRSYNSPWSYEYVYYAFLYQVGIVGVTFLLTIVIGIAIPIAYNRSDNTSKSILFGFIFFLIAAATNPMFTNMWIWTIMLLGFEFAKNNSLLRGKTIV